MTISFPKMKRNISAYMFKSVIQKNYIQLQLDDNVTENFPKDAFWVLNKCVQCPLSYSFFFLNCMIETVCSIAFRKETMCLSLSSILTHTESTPGIEKQNVMLLVVELHPN